MLPGEDPDGKSLFLQTKARVRTPAPRNALLIPRDNPRDAHDLPIETVGIPHQIPNANVRLDGQKPYPQREKEVRMEKILIDRPRRKPDELFE